MESIDLNLLVALDALLQEVSVTKAARRIGLSTPAMSHALSRIREQLGDPILVRSGRGMLMTPRAESLKAQVHTVLNQAQQALTPEKPFSPKELNRSFLILATDYVVSVLGLALDRILVQEAPYCSIRFSPNTIDDPALLRDGGADLSVGIYGDLPQEMRSRPLLTDRFVCVVRKEHPDIKKRLSLSQFIELPHIQVAPRGKPGGYIDDILREKGLSRKVARAIPFFLPALYLTSKTNYILTISERVAKQMAPALDLRLLEPPIDLRPYALSLVWHPRFDGDAGHRFLREALVRAAQEAAGESHPEARTRLDKTDPTSGQSRRRPKKRQR